MNEKTTKRRSSRSDQAHEIPLWEWLMAGLGAAILVGALAFFAVQAMNPPGPPSLTVTRDSVVQSGAQYLVMFHVRNEGRTVAGVAVEGVLEQGGVAVERANVVIPFAPNNSEANGALVFERDPRLAQVRIVIRGFTDP